MDIEKVAHDTPEKIVTFSVDPATGLMPHHGRRIADTLGLTGDLAKQAGDLAQKLYKAFTEKDMELLEINPLITTKDGKLRCLDAKMAFEGNSLYRHPDIVELRDKTEEDEKEIEASKAPLMSHLIELRSRLIKALLAFFIAAVACFFFAKTIYNVLVWPYVWVAGAENSKFIYTALLEYFITQLKLSLFGAAFIAFPVIATIHGETLHNHYHGNTVKSGDLFLLDTGAETASGYAGDLTSTFPVDRTFTNQIGRAHV